MFGWTTVMPPIGLSIKLMSMSSILNMHSLDNPQFWDMELSKFIKWTNCFIKYDPK